MDLTRYTAATARIKAANGGKVTAAQARRTAAMIKAASTARKAAMFIAR